MKIIIKENSDLQAIEASNIIAQEIQKNPNLTICFATGNSPIKTYKKLIEKYENKEISFKNVTSFNLDEYVGLDPSNPCSYHYFMDEVLFNNIDILKENVHLPNGLGDITKNAKEYEKLIEQKGGIDLMILGIGTNAHIAFNEPGSLITDVTREVQLTESTIKSNQRYFKNYDEVPKTAISMGIGTILKAKKIILLADGQAKAQAVFDSINGQITSNVPGSFLQTHNDVTFILDQDASKLLNK
ncbi:glucosamine-6-phosphate deaminase [Mycoplasma leonicaptivi]|uniref:glucosamine-6-phosphate deaminase n=1 Tax=Mycoplasma leonicaptivi TaxID=36742 RepID=UPI0004881CE3|nr:glucosamine-6-phosphate deaminase [Mycoplasma leonicaptivi]